MVNNFIMKELTHFELININGGEISFSRKAGRFAAEFVAVTVACTVWIADCAVDVIKTIF